MLKPLFVQAIYTAVSVVMIQHCLSLLFILHWQPVKDNYFVYEKEGNFVITIITGATFRHVCILLSLFFLTDSYYIAMSH